MMRWPIVRRRKFAPSALLPVLAAACLFPASCGQVNRPKSLPRVRIEQDHWSDLDLAQAKTGDWVEYEVDDDSEKATFRWKVAMVEESADSWWIEASGGPGIPAGWTVLARIAKADSLVTKCWIGKPGEEALEVPVYAGAKRKGHPGEGFDASEPGLRKVVNRERLTVGSHAMDCARVLECAAGEERGPVLTRPPGEDPTIARWKDLLVGMEDSETRWWSQDVPAFRPAPRGQVLETITWDFGCRDWRGGLVRRIRKWMRSVVTEQLVDFGKDARRTVNVPASSTR